MAYSELHHVLANFHIPIKASKHTVHSSNNFLINIHPFKVQKTPMK